MRGRAVPPASRVEVPTNCAVPSDFIWQPWRKILLAEVGDEANRSLGRSQKVEM